MFLKYKRRELPPAVLCSRRTSLIVRLAGRLPVDRRCLVFPARAVDVHVPLCRDLVVRPGRESWVCSVDLDFVVCP